MSLIFLGTGHDGKGKLLEVDHAVTYERFVNFTQEMECVKNVKLLPQWWEKFYMYIGRQHSGDSNFFKNNSFSSVFSQNS